MAIPSNYFDKQKYIKNTLEELEKLSTYDIEILLEKVIILTKDDEFPIYPIYRRVKGENGIFVSLEKEFERTDGSVVANTFISKMIKFLHEESVFLGSDLSSMLEICDTLKTIINDGSVEDKNKILQNFDSKFSFLLQIGVYGEIYKNFRLDYINLLEKSIHHMYSKLKLEEGQKKDNSLYVAIPSYVYRKAFQKHKNNKPKRFYKTGEDL